MSHINSSPADNAYLKLHFKSRAITKSQTYSRKKKKWVGRCLIDKKFSGVVTVERTFSEQETGIKASPIVLLVSTAC